MTTRPGLRSAAAHLAAGVAVAVAASVFVGFGGYFFIDEAALYGQLEVMEQEGGWTIPRPFPDKDPEAIHVPMARSDVVGDEYAPFAKHPFHVVLARGADLLGGEVGVRLLSSLGLVAAAAGAAVIAGGAHRRPAVAFWVTLLASPLLFQSNLVVAHTLGAAAAGALFAVIVRAPRRWPWVVAVALLSCAGGLLRNEFLLLGAAAAVLVGIRALRNRSVGDALVVAASFLGTAAAYLLEPELVRWAIGGRPGFETAPTASSSVGDVVAAAGRSLFEIEGLPGSTAGVAAVAVAAALVGAVGVAAGRRRPDRGILVAAGVLATAGAVVFLSEPHLLTGLVWAFPALLVLLAAVRGAVTVERTLQLPLAAAGVFLVAVALTQYSEGGGLEWGWRYAAVAVPLVTPAIADVAVQLWDRRGELPSVALVGAAGACVLVQVGGLRVAHRLVSDTEVFLDRVDVVADEADADWVVSLDASFGRFAYRLSTSGNVATATDGTGPQVLGWLAEDGAGPVLLVWRFDEEPPIDDLGGYRRSDRRWYLASEYRAELLAPR